MKRKRPQLFPLSFFGPGGFSASGEKISHSLLQHLTLVPSKGGCDIG